MVDENFMFLGILSRGAVGWPVQRWAAQRTVCCMRMSATDSFSKPGAPARFDVDLTRSNDVAKHVRCSNGFLRIGSLNRRQ